MVMTGALQQLFPVLVGRRIEHANRISQALYGVLLSGVLSLSLGFLILTIGKVFLYDLGELKDLYRVASLVGLAVSLLLVSLAYQRFVFGRDGGKKEEP